MQFASTGNENDAVRNKKERPAPEPLLIGDSDVAREIAQNLIPKHHPHLVSANIIYLYRNKSAKSGGQPVKGHVKRASPMEKHISRSYFENEEEADFIITIALDVWNDLSAKQRTALVDHLLTQCFGIEDEKSGEMRFSVRPPQVREFPEVVERHGSWNEDLTELGNCLK